MKKILPLLLALACLLTCVLGASAAASLCFVAVNDTIPLTLSGSDTPYYSGGVLYLPYSSLHAAPAGIITSYNSEEGTLVIFNRSARLTYDLNAGTLTDENDVQGPVSVAYRGGMLYIPASGLSHFGIQVSLLTSATGETILRFTDGTQVYDDSLFVDKAANLIAYLKEQNQSEEQPENNNPQQPQNDPPVSPPETVPAEVYLAFAGDAVSTETLEHLEQLEIRAAFFLTAYQLQDRELVRQLYAAGHTVAIAVEEGALDGQLQSANEALDAALFYRTVLVLAPNGTGELPGWNILEDRGLPAAEAWQNSETPMLLVCRSEAETLLQQLTQAQATVVQLVENSRVEQ